MNKSKFIKYLPDPPPVLTISSFHGPCGTSPHSCTVKKGQS